jgi:hypothetical protein
VIAPYADDAVLRTPLGRYEGRAAIEAHLAEQRERFPGFRAVVHDEFTSADGTRACFRLRLAWESGTSAETHSVRLDDGRIAEQVAGVSTFDMAKVLLADLGLDFPRDVPDPAPEIPADGTTLGWPIAGRDAVKAFVDEFHASNPGLRVALHDEFESADGTRVCWRIRLHFHNTEPFFGNPPTGERGVMPETHAITLRDGRIARLVVGDNGFAMPHQELVAWKMDYPAGTVDPHPPLAPASPYSGA